MRPPNNALPHFEQAMVPMRPPRPPQISVCFLIDSFNLPGGENRHINIPYSEGAHVIGLPLGLDVPEVIASNYKALLCMVSGMTCIITNQTSELDRYQKTAARYWDAMNCYRLELQELKSTIGGDMTVPQEVMRNLAHLKKEPVCISKLENLPPPISNERPAIPVPLVQESVIEEDMDETDDLPHTSVKRLRGEDVSTGATLSCSDVQAEKVESRAKVGTIGETVHATTTSCLTVDSATLTSSIPIDITPPLVKSVAGVGPIGEPIDAKMTSTSANCLIIDSTTNFNIPKEYAILYKKIFDKYGHIATKKVIKSNDAILLACVTGLLKIASTMQTVRGADLSQILLESWEGDTKDAETLQFNVKWLREKLNRLKISWKLSLRINKEVESREKVLDATQVKYAGLYPRKDEIDTEISEVMVNIRKSEAEISSEREAIREKMAQKYTFLYEPILGNLFS
ncbi:hypothetical protein MKX01_014492 [Papaver californicum]|nr:hypothetical protein MKX01_014492 [Papaver californicum]